MKLPKKWLCDYVDFNVSDDEFIRRMMWRGFELASADPLLPDISGVITGRIERIERHPNATKLQVCTVNLGDRETCILTNATNVFEGAVVPVAVIGAVIRGTEYKVANLRGVDSYGMFCSGEELAISDADYPGAEVDGILILNPNTPIGIDIAVALDMDDVVFDFDLTPNRPDCNSIIGLAREAAAALGQAMKTPEIPHFSDDGDASSYAGVRIDAPDLCSRYCGRVMTDIKIEPSPRWMQKRLLSVGMRPINNIVDITNYVLVEYGHPMHAFDLACLKDGQIIVRRAAQGEKVSTLDGKTFTMDEDMLLIADPEKGVGIAGVMGGLNSEIAPSTRAVLFESAVFVGSNIRKTARRLHQVTDAAARFIKGVEPVNAYLALERAIQLVTELKAGKVVGETIDVCTADLNPRCANVDVSHINRILNTKLSASKMSELLKPLAIEAVPCGDKLALTIPHFRTDIESGIEADWDIAEEVGRCYGFDNIPAEPITGPAFLGSIPKVFRLEDRALDTLVSCGCMEMYNFNFIGPAELKALRLDEGDEKLLAVKILNPFGEDQSLMRTTLYPGMLESCRRNLNFKTGHGRFMELGNVHLDNNAVLPEERRMVGIAVFGDNESFFTLKGIVERLLLAFGVDNASFTAGGGRYFHPGRRAVIRVGDTYIGEMDQPHPDTLKDFDISVPVYMAELSFKALCKVEHVVRGFVPMPRFPVVQRDIAVTCRESVTSAELAEVIRNVKIGLIIENVELFDVYRGVGILPGFKSMAYSFTLRAEDHTLSDDEIKHAMDAVILSLSQSGAALRI